MQRIPGAMLVAVTAGACGASTAALALNPAGLYVGAGAGYSTIRSDDPAYGLPAYFNDHQAAWKGIIGIKPPILPIGLEAEYIDFGRPGNHRGKYDVNYYGHDSHPRAAALFAIGYLPIPVPFVDFYAKAGAARLKTTVNTNVSNCTSAALSCTGVVASVFRRDLTNTKFAYGAGVQSRLPFGIAVRAEYERISSSYGDPDAFTVSATWTF